MEKDVKVRFFSGNSGGLFLLHFPINQSRILETPYAKGARKMYEITKSNTNPQILVLLNCNIWENTANTPTPRQKKAMTAYATILAETDFLQNTEAVMPTIPKVMMQII